MAEPAAVHDHPGGPPAEPGEVVVLSDEEKKAKKKKKIIKMVGIFVLLLLVFHVVSGKVIKPHYKLHPPAGATYGLGGITTNLSDGHLAQISITLQLTMAANSKTIAKDNSELTGKTVQLIGSQSFASLLPAAGRAALQSNLLTTYQKVLGLNRGGEQVSGVYFTSFVLQ